MAKCPNCQATVQWNADACADCGAAFDNPDGWQPVAETAEEARLLDEKQRRMRLASRPPAAPPRRPRKSIAPALYRFALIVMFIAFVAHFLYPYVRAAFPAGRGAVGAQVLHVLLSVKMLAYPLSEFQLVRYLIAASGLQIDVHALVMAATILFWAQLILLLRRLALSRSGTIALPAVLNGLWMVPLMVAFACWLVAVLIFLSPIPLSLISPKLAWGVQIGNTLLTGRLFLPALLFGPIFFLLELFSLAREGLFPRRRLAASAP